MDKKIHFKAVEHIQYEIDMLKITYSSLRCSPNQATTNVLLESFAIHARNLFYFFYTEDSKRKKDDIIVNDYIMRRALFKKMRSPKAHLKLVLKKTAKQVAHLTYYRVRYNKKTKPWKFHEIYQCLEKTVEAFKQALPPDKIGWFKF